MRARRAFAAAFLALAPSLAAAGGGGFGPSVAPEVEPLDFAPWMEGAKVEFRGAFAIRPPFEEFGGLSGLVMEGPRRALAISDRARWLRLDLKIEGRRLEGIEAVAAAPVAGAPDEESEDDPWDPEALTRGARGELWVAFEQDHRLQPVDGPEAAPGPVLQRDEWTRYGGNSGLEALATAPDGALWSIRERVEGAGHPVFAIGADGWRLATLPEDGPYRPTGADFGPDGALYLAERAFSLVGGFRFRLRRIVWGDGPTPETAEELLRLPTESLIDNIEGIAVWEEGGETLILVVSDDNFSVFQRNVAALFALR
ncbi:MAG: esterase-like activity of phytase family protein [Pseudomonadota bacterium]